MENQFVFNGKTFSAVGFRNAAIKAYLQTESGQANICKFLGSKRSGAIRIKGWNLSGRKSAEQLAELLAHAFAKSPFTPTPFPLGEGKLKEFLVGEFIEFCKFQLDEAEAYRNWVQEQKVIKAEKPVYSPQVQRMRDRELAAAKRAVAFRL